MELRSGRFGKYFACTNDQCKNTRKLLRNGEPAPPRADAIPMPELPCAKSDGHFVLRDGAAGIFLASSLYPRSRETRNPLVKELLPHAEKVDPKYQFLLSAPVADDDGNAAVIRFKRKEKIHYVMSEIEGKPTGWQAFYDDGGKRWRIEKAVKRPAKKKATAKKKSCQDIFVKVRLRRLLAVCAMARCCLLAGKNAYRVKNKVRSAEGRSMVSCKRNRKRHTARPRSESPAVFSFISFFKARWCYEYSSQFCRWWWPDQTSERADPQRALGAFASGRQVGR